MLLLSDEAMDGIGLQELQNIVKTYKQNVETTVCDELKATLKTIQRTCSLVLWHDHARLPIHHDYTQCITLRCLRMNLQFRQK